MRLQRDNEPDDDRGGAAATTTTTTAAVGNDDGLDAPQNHSNAPTNTDAARVLLRCRQKLQVRRADDGAARA